MDVSQCVPYRLSELLSLFGATDLLNDIDGTFFRSDHAVVSCQVNLSCCGGQLQEPTNQQQKGRDGGERNKNDNRLHANVDDPLKRTGNSDHLPTCLKATSARRLLPPPRPCHDGNRDLSTIGQKVHVRLRQIDPTTGRRPAFFRNRAGWLKLLVFVRSLWPFGS